MVYAQGILIIVLILLCGEIIFIFAPMLIITPIIDMLYTSATMIEIDDIMIIIIFKYFYTQWVGNRINITGASSVLIMTFIWFIKVFYSGSHAGWKGLLADEVNGNDLDAAIELIMYYLLMQFSSSCGSIFSCVDCVHSSISLNSMRALAILRISALSCTALYFA